jgi:hypothetical protein
MRRRVVGSREEEGVVALANPREEGVEAVLDEALDAGVAARHVPRARGGARRLARANRAERSREQDRVEDRAEGVRGVRGGDAERRELVDLAVHREHAGARALRPRGTRAPREGARERARVCDRARRGGRV